LQLVQDRLGEQLDQAFHRLRLAHLGVPVPLAAEETLEGSVRVFHPELRGEIVDVPRLGDLRAVFDLEHHLIR
jgi:hypothetical protein